MKLIDLYIARQVLGAILAVMLVIVGLDLIFALVDQLGDLQADYDLSAALHYVALTAPGRLYEHLPLSALVGCLLGLGTLATHSELTAIRAAGCSITRIFRAVIQPVILLACVAVVIGEFVVPSAEQNAQSFRSVKMSGGQALAARGVWHRDGNQYIHINTVINGNEIRSITRYWFDDKHNLLRSSFAHTGHYQQEGEYWLLEKVDNTWFKDNKTTAKRIESEQWKVGLTPQLLSVVVVRPENLSMRGLWRYIEYLAEQGLESSRYQLALWSKVLQPLAIIVLVFVAVSFIFGPLRSVTVGQRLIAGIIVGMCFKLVQDMLGPASAVFGFHPLIAVLLPIGLCILAGLILIRRAN